MNKETLKFISANFKRNTLHTVLAMKDKIARVESMLGLAPSRPKMDAKLMADRLLELEERLEVENPNAAALLASEEKPASVPVAVPLVAASIAPATLPAAVKTVAAVVAAGSDAPTQLVASFGEYLKMTGESRQQFRTLGGSLNAVDGTTFEAMTPKLKSEFCRAGGRVLNDSTPQQRYAPGHPEKGQNMSLRTSFAGNGAPKSSAEFEAMTAQEQMDFMRTGGKINN
jgi:hypothetical protein